MITRIALSAVMTVVLANSAAFAQQKDERGCKDHPMFTRMPDYWIHSCSEKQFDARTFMTGAKTTQVVEGHVWDVRFYPQATLKMKPSELQIKRNFEAAVAKLGGKLVTTQKNRQIFTLQQNGQEFWVDVWTEFTGKYGYTIVQKAGMAQDIVANAEVFSNDIQRTGHAAVYGILFDTGKSDIKPESAQAIGEIAKLLAANPALRLHVVGHTDNVGVLDANMKLSQDRAAAVVTALVQTHKIAAARLRAFGVGPYAPVESNDTDQGRAKNRRVELVKQ